MKVCKSQVRHFSSFFTCQDGLCFCHNVSGLCKATGIACNSNKWRLFINNSSKSLKAVLLRNGNKYPSLSLAHLVHFKEECNSVKTLLEVLKYDDYGWEIIRNFKMVAFLMGIQ
ncbi:uncharacterized protein LOC143240141 [Tachypleus tridentatus]|uniref:uncharacterized protein LOC143240141 n=1 Tax=Tachypleus tridentatus TaxID=6853 RepID=UPI003FD1353C